MNETERVYEMYVKKDTLSIRKMLHDRYSANKYGWNNWVFDQYEFQNGMKVLELACGTADIWSGKESRLPEIEIILSDFSPLMVEKAKSLLSGNPVFSFMQIDIQEIPFDNETFDAVIANHMLYHVPDTEKALSEVSRVLKPNGLFYSTTIGENSMKELNSMYRKLEDKDPSASFSYSGSKTYTLENGAKQLYKYFSAVEQRQYTDSLQVTCADDLIAYIKSYNNIPDVLERELLKLVKDGFSDDGIFYISKEQGIFICEKI